MQILHKFQWLLTVIALSWSKILPVKETGIDNKKKSLFSIKVFSTKKYFSVLRCVHKYLTIYIHILVY